MEGLPRRFQRDFDFVPGGRRGAADVGAVADARDAGDRGELPGIRRRVTRGVRARDVRRTGGRRKGRMPVGCGVRRRGFIPRDAAGSAFRTPFRTPSGLVDPRWRLHRRRDSTRGRARVLRHRGTGGFRSGGRRGGGVGESRFVRFGSFAGIRRAGRVRRRSPSIGRRRRARARAMDHRDVVRARPGPVPGRPVHPAGRREGSAGRDPRRRASVVGHRFIFTLQTRGAASRSEGCVRRRRRVRPRAPRKTRRRDRDARRRARGGAHGSWERRGRLVRVRLPDP